MPVHYIGALSTLILISSIPFLFLPAQATKIVAGSIIKKRGKAPAFLDEQRSRKKDSLNISGIKVSSFIRHNSHNHGRAHRSASRPAFAHASGGGDSSDGGGSDSGGDPPDCNSYPFLVIPLQNLYRKLSNFLFPWRVSPVLACWGRGSGCCWLSYHDCSTKVVSA